MTTYLLRKSLVAAAAGLALATSAIAFSGAASADPRFVREGWRHEYNEHHFRHFRDDDHRFGHFRYFPGCWRPTRFGPVNVCRY